MKFVLTLDSLEYLEFTVKMSVAEILLMVSPFSAAGGVGIEDVPEIVDGLSTSGKKVTLLWDRYCSESEINELTLIYKRYFKDISSVRFADPGVGMSVAEALPEHKRHFLMWDGHQNLEGILEWIAVLPELQRIILSNQIPLDRIRHITDRIEMPVEIKGLGRFQLFYSRRNLIYNHISNATCCSLSSTDRPSQFFPVHETGYGTVVMNDNDLFLLDRINEIQNAGIDYLWLEPTSAEQFRLLMEAGDLLENHQKVRTNWTRPVTSGFFDENRTDELMVRLTNAFLRDEKGDSMAVVLESVKNSHTLLQLHKAVELPCSVTFMTPERRVVPFDIVYLKDLQHNHYEAHVRPGIFLLPWIKHVVPGAIMKRS